MKATVRYGLIVGVIGLVLNICVALVLGFCGPLATIIAGAIAGYLGARAETTVTKGDAAREGAIAGAITGGLMLFGQILGASLSLGFVQWTGIDFGFGTVPNANANPEELVAYYGAGLGVACCIGIGDLIAGGIAGAIAGYLAGPTQSQDVDSMNNFNAPQNY